MTLCLGLRESLKRGTHPRPSLGLWSALALAAALLAAGCGARAHRAPRPGAKAPSVCLTSGASVVAGFARLSAAAVRSVEATGNNAAPECRFSAGGLRVVVNLDSAPQAYTRLERTIVEAGQQFGTVRSFAAPVAVGGIGLDAAWLPDQDELITADQRRLISVKVSWTGSRWPRQALAGALARRYLAS